MATPAPEPSPHLSTLRLVLGDQLSDGLAGLSDLDPARDVVLMAEVRDEATYVRHHKQKIALTFAAMRAHAARLEARGVAVRYVRIDAPDNSHSIVGELGRAIAAMDFDRVVITECGEWRLAEALNGFGRRRACPSKSGRIGASSARTTASGVGRPRNASCGWSSSIAKCGVRRVC